MKPKVVAAVVFVLLGSTALLWFEPVSAIERFSSEISQYPHLAPLLFVCAYIVTCVLLLPGFLLTAVAGMLFGRVVGFLCVSSGATLGACAAFLVARYLARDSVTTYLTGHPKLSALDRAVTKVGGRIVLLCRLCPLIPFRFSNYVFGITNIRFSTFALYTWIGTIPSAALYVYLGSLARNITELSQRERTPEEWLALVAGALLLGVVAVYLSNIARTALEQELGPKTGNV